MWPHKKLLRTRGRAVLAWLLPTIPSRDGNRLLVTNVPDHTPKEFVKRYKCLADVERDLGPSSQKSKLRQCITAYRKESAHTPC